MVNKQFDNIPDELKVLSQWVVSGVSKDKPKIPYNSRDMTPAKVDESATWSSYDESTARVHSCEAQGVGFVFNGNGYCGIDLDDVFDNGILKPEVQTIYEQLDSYTELSVSGKGMHIIVKVDDIALEHHRRNSIEIYDNLRYFIMTGNVFGKLKPISYRSTQLQVIHDRYLKPSSPTQQPPQTLQTLNNADVDATIDKAMKGINGDKFEALFKGEWQKFGTYPSHSEADLGFANMLAYWTSCNAAMMDVIFRRSGLMRQKWDDVHGAGTYGNQVIMKAINDFTNYKSQGAAAINSIASVKPADYTDVGNANVLTSVFMNRIIFVRSLGYLTWTGQYYQENDLGALELAMDLSEQMLKESLSALSAARTELAIAESLQDVNRIRRAKHDEKSALEYHRHALRTREAPKIIRMLELSKPALHVELERLDSNPFLLNTPGGIVDLRTGLTYPHAAAELCTKITAIAPGIDGCQEWSNFLQWVTCGDKDMEDFLQMVAGMSAVGAVFVESLVIPFGEGGNGKSTLFNPINDVLGSYGGTIRPETLMTGRSNNTADLATLKGKRFVIAAELDEGENLSSSMLKKMVSIDKVNARRMYHDPETFKPSHTLVLYTNHLPTVNSTDNGTWRRIIAVRFKATVSPQTDIKGYGDVLFSRSGGAILTWVINGAVKFCRNGCKLTIPPSIIAETEKYKADNDWIENFIDECCVRDASKKEPGSHLYKAYKDWSEKGGERARRKNVFTDELIKHGFRKYRASDKTCWYGIGLV